MKVTMTWHYDGREFKPFTLEYGFVPTLVGFGWMSFDSDGWGMPVDKLLVERLITELATEPHSGRFGYDGGYYTYTTEGDR